MGGSDPVRVSAKGKRSHPAAAHGTASFFRRNQGLKGRIVVPIRVILCPTDFSKRSAYALHVACVLPRDLDVAELGQPRRYDTKLGHCTHTAAWRSAKRVKCPDLSLGVWSPESVVYFSDITGRSAH
jgi:hypothetical protein